MAVTAALKEAVRAVLRKAPGPLTAADIVEGLPAQLAAGPRDVPRAVGACPDCVSVARGRYVWTFGAVTGASVLFDLQPGEPSVAGLSLEATTLLWPLELGRSPRRMQTRPAQVRLPDGRTQRWEYDDWAGHGYFFASTWRRAPAATGGRIRILRCLDGEAGLYAVRDAEPAPLGAVARRDAEVVEAARAALDPGRSYHPGYIALRVLVAGAYHGDVPPSPLAEIFRRPPFFVDGGDVQLRTDLTPAVWSLLRPRWQDFAGSELPPGGRRLHPAAAADAGYLLRVSLGGRWSADFEARADHTLTDLHLAIQHAVRFDEHHLYAFTLSSHRRDALTTVPCPEARFQEPPHASEVTLGAFDPQPGHVFHYVFDFGDEWWFRIAVLRRTGGDSPGRAATGLPRLVAVQGQPPVQYHGRRDG